jgi:hypothetical protein
MDNPFKKILHQEELPKMLRKKVMNDISFIKLAIDMTDLLMVQYPGTIDNLLRLNKKK